MPTLDALFDRFLRERTYLKNISPKTRVWYQTAWKSFTAVMPAEFAHIERPVGATPITRADLSGFVVALRERNVRPVSVNTWLRALNAFCRWLHEEGLATEGVRMKPLRLERRLVQTIDAPGLRLLLAYRPRGFAELRVHTVACAILDTGCRIDELLSARTTAFDLDDLLLTVVGKGNKERRVPFSLELRKRVVRFQQTKIRCGVAGEWMFPERRGGRWHSRNALRSYHLLLDKAGLPRSGFHRLRHTFATEYLRSGGEVVRLSRVLGHTEVNTTMKYLHLVTADIQAPHQKLSILNRLR
jgi:integrase/recombinase XerD